MNWSAALVALAAPVVTVTSTVPEPAGAVAVIVVSLLTLNNVAGMAPKFTADAPVKFVPVIVTDVPPAVEPDGGLRPVTVGGGGGVYVNWSLELMALVPWPVVTVTSTAPRIPAGAVALMVLSFCTAYVVAAMPPKFTADAPVKFVPVIVTDVPPAVGPEDGLTALTMGTVSGGPAVMETFWTWWMSLNPPVAPVNPTSTYGGRLVA